MRDTSLVDSVGLIRRQVAMLRALKHPNIVLYMGIVKLKEDQFGIVQEYVRGGSLRHALSDTKRKLSWGLRLSLLQDIAQGLVYLHTQRVLHRDLKAENVLLEPLSEEEPHKEGLYRAKVLRFTRPSLRLIRVPDR